MSHVAIVLLVEAIIVLGAAVQALLGSYVLVMFGLAPYQAAWPAALTRAAHLLLWPIARLGRQAPEQVGPPVILLAMAVYLALTIAAVGAVNLAVRPAAPPSAGRGRGRAGG